MDEDKLSQILSLMFQQTKVSGGAKAKLKAKLFESSDSSKSRENFELPDERMDFVAAAGDAVDATEEEQKTKQNETH
ncbi:MAG: hypothetical protein FWG02_03320 [Holophagaceae bacterium]|nr:hypothetical protein [Holophagaceae bacterium]